mmetsp:Transcript_23274/g.36553  ORF Transcript_23274/g.36553 Transcript_23274/m.36553 type:complete len:219 (-) Transcript_23274:301-957(-)
MHFDESGFLCRGMEVFGVKDSVVCMDSAYHLGGAGEVLKVDAGLKFDLVVSCLHLHRDVHFDILSVKVKVLGERNFASSDNVAVGHYVNLHRAVHELTEVSVKPQLFQPSPLGVSGLALYGGLDVHLVFRDVCLELELAAGLLSTDKGKVGDRTATKVHLQMNDLCHLNLELNPSSRLSLVDDLETVRYRAREESVKVHLCAANVFLAPEVLVVDIND